MISIPRHHILIACFPKSGSTYLSRLTSNLPNMKTVSLTSGYGRREQELSIEKLMLYNKNNYVAQHHVRYSTTTKELINIFRIKPVVLVRNIFDVVVSVHDWYNKGNIISPMGFVPEDYSNWNDNKSFNFIVDMIIPWYLNFFCSWNLRKEKLLLTYEDYTENTNECLRKIAEYGNIKCKDSDIDNSIKKASKQNTRKNVGVSGRGEKLPDNIKDKICKMAKYYDNIDFSPIGL